MPNLRGREVPKDQAAEQERNGRDCDTESDDESDFESTEEAERGPAEKSGYGQKGSSQRGEPKPTIEGEKNEDELETANSDESENRSEGADSVRMFDSDTLNQPRPKRKRRQQEKRRHRDSRRADKGRVDSIFLKSPERIESLGMIMGLCLLVYTLGERQIRTPSRESKSTVKINWVNQLTAPLYAVFLHAFSLFI